MKTTTIRVSTCEKCVKRCQFFDTKRFDLCTSFLSYGKARELQSKRDKLLVPKKPINKASLTYKPFKELLKK
jgi:hypothetical protein